jgi:hypothetical protein
MAFAFEKLLVYQKAVDFSDSVCAKSETFARGYGFLADQLNRRRQRPFYQARPQKLLRHCPRLGA